MAIRNSLSHDNKYRGFNTFGVNWNVHVESLTTRNNGAYYKHGGEIGILNGYWGPTNNIKNPATGIVERGLTQDITFLNCSFTPAAGKWHMYVQTDVAGVTLGTVFPSKMLMYNSGAQDWRFRIDWNNKITRPQLEPYVLSTYGVNVVTS
jgi:hypothetical protein